MSGDQPGLRRRMDQEALRISSQHEKLGELYALVDGCVERGDARGVAASFDRFRDALDAHFTVEDQLFLPALHGLRPDLDGELAEIARDHDRYREELDRLGELVAPQHLRAFGERLRAFGRVLAAHESREEQLVTRITGKAAGEVGRRAASRRRAKSTEP